MPRQSVKSHRRERRDRAEKKIFSAVFVRSALKLAPN